MSTKISLIFTKSKVCTKIFAKHCKFCELKNQKKNVIIYLENFAK